MDTRELEERVYHWLGEALFFIGLSWGERNIKDVPFISEIGKSLMVKWFYNYNVLKIQLVEKDRFNHWLGTYAIGNHNPFIFDVARNTIDAAKMEIVEIAIMEFLPGICISTCYSCDNRFWTERTGNEFYCQQCYSVLQPETSNKSGYVYIFGSKKDGFYKIGSSNVPISRMKDYEKSKLPFRVELIYSIPTDDKKKAETELHRLFRANRTNGEWFKLSDEELNKVIVLKAYQSGHWIK